MDSCVNYVYGFLNASFVALIYVLSIYIWPNHRRRDDPQTIKRRFVSVLGVNLITIYYTLYLSNQTIAQAFFWNQVTWIKLVRVFVWPIWVCLCFFIGPLCSLWVYPEPDYTRFNENKEKQLIVLRNYLIAPLSEELAYRLVLNQLLLLFNYTPLTASLVSCTLFSLAHSHHYFWSSHKDVAVARSVLLVQLSFTFIFGLFACIVYWRTESILSCILIHSLCNFLEFPNFPVIFSNFYLTILTVIGLIVGIAQLIYL